MPSRSSIIDSMHYYLSGLMIYYTCFWHVKGKPYYHASNISSISLSHLPVINRFFLYNCANILEHLLTASVVNVTSSQPAFFMEHDTCFMKIHLPSFFKFYLSSATLFTLSKFCGKQRQLECHTLNVMIKQTQNWIEQLFCDNELQNIPTTVSVLQTL